MAGVVLAIKPDGDLLWYRYTGDGTADQTGATGWEPNSSNPIGRGWQNFQQVLGIGDGEVLAIKPDGDLLWYRYTGDGTADQTGATGWEPNSSNPIGRGWQNFQQVLGIGDGRGVGDQARWRPALVPLHRRRHGRPDGRHRLGTQLE